MARALTTGVLPGYAQRFAADRVFGGGGTTKRKQWE